jgi:Fic family protein
MIGFDDVELAFQPSMYRVCPILFILYRLTGIIQTSEKGIKTFDRVLQLQKTINEKANTFGRRTADADKVMDDLYGNPVITALKVEQIIGKLNVSAYKLIADMEKMGILHEITGGQRKRLYLFQEYLDLF